MSSNNNRGGGGRGNNNNNRGGGRGNRGRGNQQQQQQQPSPGSPFVVMQPAPNPNSTSTSSTVIQPNPNGTASVWANRGRGGGGGAWQQQQQQTSTPPPPPPPQQQQQQQQQQRSPQQFSSPSRGGGRGRGADSGGRGRGGGGGGSHSSGSTWSREGSSGGAGRRTICAWIGRPLPLSAVASEFTSKGIDLRIFSDANPAAAVKTADAFVMEHSRHIFALVLETPAAIQHFAEKREFLVAGGIAICAIITPFSAPDISADILTTARAASGGHGGLVLDCRSFGIQHYWLQMSAALQKLLARSGELLIDIPAGLPRSAVFLGTSPLGRVFGYSERGVRCVARATERVDAASLLQYERRACCKDDSVIATFPIDRSQLGSASGLLLVRSVKYLKHMELNKDPMPVCLLLRVAERMLQAMTVVHKNELLFRCLSPLIVSLIMEQGSAPPRFKLDTSFCVCKESAATMWTDLLLPRYAAPEGIIWEAPTAWAATDNVRRNSFCEASDVWSWACCLLRLATGKQPFEALSRTGEPNLAELIAYLRSCVERGEVAPTAAIPDMPGMPIQFNRIIFSCLSFDPAKRPTPQQLLADPIFSSLSASRPSLERTKFEMATFFKRPLPDGGNKAELSAQLMKLQRKTKSQGAGFSLAPGSDCFDVSNMVLHNRFEQKLKEARQQQQQQQQMQLQASSSGSGSSPTKQQQQQQHQDPGAAENSPTQLQAPSHSSGDDATTTAGGGENTTTMMMAQSSSASALSGSLVASAAAAANASSGTGIGSGTTANSIFVFLAAKDEISAEPLLRWGILPSSDPLSETALSTSSSSSSSGASGGALASAVKKKNKSVSLSRFPLAAARALRKGEGLREGELLRNIILFEVLTLGAVCKEADLGDADVISAHQTDGDKGGVDILVDQERILLLKPQTAVIRPLYVLSVKVERSVVSALLRAPGSGKRRFVMLDKKLGAGAQGAVYQGLEINGPIHRPVAIKVQKLADDKAAEAIASELRTMMQMKSHSNIAQVVHAETVASGALGSSSMVLIVLELMAATLGDLVAQSRVSEGELLKILFEASNGLLSLHHAGQLHSDVKLDNVGIALDGSVKLLDLGMATTGKIRGFTMSYAAPEIFEQISQQQGAAVAAAVETAAAAESASSACLSSASDIYSLGITIWLAAKGWRRFPGRDVLDFSQPEWIQQRQRLLTEQMSKDITREFQQVLLSMLDPDPQKRPTAQDLVSHDIYFTYASGKGDQQQQQETTASLSAQNSFNMFNSSSMNLMNSTSGGTNLVQQLTTLGGGSVLANNNNQSVPARSVTAAGSSGGIAAAAGTNEQTVSINLGEFSMPIDFLSQFVSSSTLPDQKQ